MLRDLCSLGGVSLAGTESEWSSYMRETITCQKVESNRKKLEKVVWYFRKHGASVNYVDGRMQMLLQHAILIDNLQVVDSLLRYGAERNTMNASNRIVMVMRRRVLGGMFRRN